MKAVVTGGAGFIGSHVVDQLVESGNDVTVVDDFSSGKEANLAHHNGQVQVIELDISIPGAAEQIAECKPDVICHLAAQPSVKVSVEEPLLDARVNILGSLNVLEAARMAKTGRVVYAASGGTLYGDVDPSMLPADESLARHPMSHYGVSKGATIDYLELYRHMYDISYVALALANVYGPRQDPHGEAGVVAIFSEALAESRPCTIFGDGEQTRDFVYVEDVARAFATAAAGTGKDVVVNIGTGIETSVNQLYSGLANAAGSSEPAQYGPPRAGDIARSSLNPARAGDLLGWSPQVGLADGTKLSYEWFADRH